MHLMYPEEANDLHYVKLGEDAGKKNTWLFPDIYASFESVKEINGNIIIEPGYYYITSGEALRKTEVLISDIKQAIDEYTCDIVIEQLEVLLSDIKEFYLLLEEVKGPSLYLEVTKCEDGMYNGNICARKDPKKKKDKK